MLKACLGKSLPEADLRTAPTRMRAYQTRDWGHAVRALLYPDNNYNLLLAAKSLDTKVPVGIEAKVWVRKNYSFTKIFQSWIVR